MVNVYMKPKLPRNLTWRMEMKSMFWWSRWVVNDHAFSILYLIAKSIKFFVLVRGVDFELILV